MGQITASIVTYHTPPGELEACVASLARAERVWVIDNASDPGMVARCKAIAHPSIVYIPAENRGYGAGHNIAISEALAGGTDFHLVVNSDVTFEPFMLTRAADILDSLPYTGLLHPRLRYPSGEEQYSVRLLPTPLDLIAHRFLPRRLVSRLMDRYELRAHPRDKELIATPYVQGSFMLFSADALRDLKDRYGYFFDERFFMYPEDIDISRRIASTERDVAYEPAVEAIHNHRAASRRSLRMLAVHAVNMTRYFNKWGWFYDPERRQLNSLTLSKL